MQFTLFLAALALFVCTNDLKAQISPASVTKTEVAALTIKVVDASGAPVKDDFVIVQDLSNRESEMFRALTDVTGTIRTKPLAPGVYRAIATAPYGLWQTEVREFLVKTTPIELTVRVAPEATHGYGDVVPVRSRNFRLKVLTAEGRPASAADLFVRDKNATLYLERRYRTAADGGASIELVANPTIVTVIYKDALWTEELTPKSLHTTIRLPH